MFNPIPCFKLRFLRSQGQYNKGGLYHLPEVAAKVVLKQGIAREED